MAQRTSRSTSRGARRALTALTAAVTASLLAGCAAGAPGASSPSLPASSAGGASRASGAPGAAGGSVCPSAAELGERGLYDPTDGVRLPQGFEAAEAVECRVETREYDGAGAWQVLVERRATAGLAALVAALSAADEPTPLTGVGCDSMGYQVAWIALRDADGRWTHPAVPATACGQPQVAALAALAAVPFAEVAVTRLDQVRTPAQVALEAEATAAGCTTEFKNLVAMYDAEQRGMVAPTRAGEVVVPAGAALSVCRMIARPPDAGEVLHFVSGDRLTGDDATALAQALRASTGPAGECTTAATSLAVVLPGNGGYVLVELDGCHRVLSEQGRSTYTRASPALLTALR